MQKKSLKEKIRDNADAIVAGTALAACGASLIAISIAAAKQAQAAQEQLMAAINRGDTILPNPDGSYWIIPNNK